ncbi:hypothetical protein V8E36_005684 [Tilletia maclaganii]
MAGFHPDGGTYYLPRDTLEPPKDLQLQIFPQIEQWQARIDKGEISTTGGADKFLRLLVHLRRVLLQDLPSLAEVNPAHPVLQSAMFRGTAYQHWEQQQADYLAKHTSPLELSLRLVVPTISEQLNNIAQQQTLIQQQLTRDEERRQASEDLHRRRDEAIMYEIQRHNRAIAAIQSAPASSFVALAQVSVPGDGAEDSLFGAAASASASAAAYFDEEWDTGFAGGPALKTLEKDHGTAWCGGPSTAKRRAFLRRMTIIKRIRDSTATEGTTEDVIKKLQAKMGSHSLDWLRKQIDRE